MPHIRSRADLRSNSPPSPKYFDQLIDAYAQGQSGRFVHLGYWDASNTTHGPSRADESPFELAQGRLNEFVLGRLPLKNGQAILDVGCGFGGTLAHVNERYGDMHLTGLNVDKRQLAICESIVPQHENRFLWVQGDACDLPFLADSFDHVVCLEAMFHFQDRRTFMQEAARVLRRTGTLVVTDVLVDECLFESDLPLFAVFATLQSGYGPWPEIQTTPSQWEGLARQAGLAVRTRFDLSRNTVYSHDYTIPEELSDFHPVENPELQAALMLRWLHQRSLLRYMCYSLVRS